MQSRLRIIVTGLIAQHPRLGGVAWDYLQYVVGLARLGYEVYYFEDSGQWPYSQDGGPTGDQWIVDDCKPNVQHLAGLMSRFGLGERWAYRFAVTGRWFGMSRAKRREIVETADLLLNVSGTLHRPADYRRVKRLVYVDSDPVFTQVKLKLDRGQKKFQKRVAAHDIFFSFGEQIANGFPQTGHHWLPTRQPIVLSEWLATVPSRDVFTTVMSWASYKPVAYRGCKYGQKDVEFRRFLDLPNRVGTGLLEVAMGDTRHANWETNDVETILPARRGHPKGTARELLHDHGWRTANAYEVCADVDAYRNYIASSKAEWSVAKNGYVVGQSGWFSCRSACYLAAGKPVVVQDTGFAAVLPVGEGILAFRTVDEAAAAIREVVEHYGRHSKTARAVAEEYFDSDKVLRRLLDNVSRNG